MPDNIISAPIEATTTAKVNKFKDSLTESGVTGYTVVPVMDKKFRIHGNDLQTVKALSTIKAKPGSDSWNSTMSKIKAYFKTATGTEPSRLFYQGKVYSI